MRFNWLMLIGAAALAAVVMSTAHAAAAAGPEDELPDGEGKTILQRSCTTCHDLTEVMKLRGFYNKDQWRDIVNTMVEYGAELKKEEIEVLTDYLAQHLGKPTP